MHRVSATRLADYLFRLTSCWILPYEVAWSLTETSLIVCVQCSLTLSNRVHTF